MVDRAYATIEHKTDFGLSVRNVTSWVSYEKFYQNVYPGTALNAPGAGLVGLVAYNNMNNRENIFNQTDFTYKFGTGPIRHTVVVGGEVGRQSGLAYREEGFFPGNATTITIDPARRFRMFRSWK